MFLVVVIALRMMSGVFEDSILGIIGLTLGERAEGVPLIDWSSLSWMNPSGWSTDGIKDAINGWVHDVVDSILPAFIYTFHITTIYAMMIVRVKVAGTIANIGKWMSLAA